MKKIIVNFTNTYRKEDYSETGYIDCSDISGTDMYLDDEAKAEIIKRLGNDSYRGIHLIDSGNYHYITSLFAGMIREPFVLIYLDNHTDMKPAMFDMLSCGSWAKQVLTENDFLQKMIMLGPPQKSIGEVDDVLLNDKRLLIVSGEECESSANNICRNIFEFIDDRKEIPVYLSIDKDVLSTDELTTNWDQGNMSMKSLLSLIKKISQNREVIGVDICGLLPISEKESTLAYEKDLETDLRIISLFE